MSALLQGVMTDGLQLTLLPLKAALVVSGGEHEVKSSAHCGKKSGLDLVEYMSALAHLHKAGSCGHC